MKEASKVTMFLILLGCLFLVSAALASPTATTVDRSVTGGGGGPAGAGIYALNGTIGQPVVGGIGGDACRLGAGFWGGMGALAREPYRFYLPVVLSS